MEKLLIIEDNEDIVTQLKWGLSKDYSVSTAGDVETALGLIKKEGFDVVTLDLGLPPSPEGTEAGFRCLGEILDEFPHTKVIMITGNSATGSALKAISMGAYDYCEKPIEISELKVILKRAFYLHGLEQEIRKLQGIIHTDGGFEGMIGNCPKMREVYATIKKVAASEGTILIIGESGTGKELVARAIHKRSLRREGPFVPVNCGGIPEQLIESELFGHEKGAFTDAKTQSIGIVEKAHGGTLFLDEIGELPVQLQVKLLRFLQDRKIQRIGGRKEIEVDARIISASNTDLQKATKENTFREDLYFRISVLTIQLPPLRDRGDDVFLLANSFLSRFNYINKKDIKGFSPQAVRALGSYGWPGNVRELENKIQRAVIMGDDKVIRPQDVSLGTEEMEMPQPDTKPLTLRDARQKFESEVIQKALARNQWNISKTAEELGLSRPTLHDLINKYEIKIRRE